MKLCFKYEQLEKSIIPQINNIIDELLLVQEENRNIDIPVDFKYYNYLKNSIDNYYLWINDFRNLIDKIENINLTLTNNLDEINQELNNIEDFVYKKG